MRGCWREWEWAKRGAVDECGHTRGRSCDWGEEREGYANANRQVQGFAGPLGWIPQSPVDVRHQGVVQGAATPLLFDIITNRNEIACCCKPHLHLFIHQGATQSIGQRQ